MACSPGDSAVQAPKATAAISLPNVGMALQRHVDFIFLLSYTFHGSRAVQNAAPDSGNTQEQKALIALRGRRSLSRLFAFLDFLAHKQQQQQFAIHQ
jgi:hypothetical protein